MLVQVSKQAIGRVAALLHRSQGDGTVLITVLGKGERVARLPITDRRSVAGSTVARAAGGLAGDS